MSETVVKADPKRQRWVLLISALAAALAVRFIYELDRTLEEIARVGLLNPGSSSRADPSGQPEFSSRDFGPLGLMALYLIIQGTRIALAEQHPLPGARVVRDTKVRFGEAAKRRALVGFTLAALLIVAAFWLPRVGLHYISQTIVIPESVEIPQMIDPDAFPGGVPGPHLIDPKDSRNPLSGGKNRTRGVPKPDQSQGAEDSEGSPDSP